MPDVEYIDNMKTPSKSETTSGWKWKVI